MIKGDKPSGYFVTYDENGRRIEGETRQCAHCQYTWEYKPGSGRRYSICMNCTGLLCGRPVCMRMKCVPFSDGMLDGRYIMTSTGTVAHKGEFLREESLRSQIQQKYGGEPILKDK